VGIRPVAIRQSKPSKSKRKTHPVGSACSNLQDQLEDFLDIAELAAPNLCYEPGPPPDYAKGNSYLSDLGQRTSRLKFVIATLPDPVHTHLPVVFDQFTVAIQEGGQDEKYDFDGSWFPWDEEENVLLPSRRREDFQRGKGTEGNAARDYPLSKVRKLRWL